MSNAALAYPLGRTDLRRARLLRQNVLRPVRELRPLREVRVAGVPLQAASGHPRHIKRSQLIALIIIAIVLHASLGWVLLNHRSSAPVKALKQELNIELVRPPKPVEPPKPEPPKPEPPKAAPPKPRPTPQVVPQIQQAVIEPAPEAISNEPAIAVAPVAPPAPEPAPPLPVTAPVGRAGYLNNPAPEYPPQALRQGWQGTVLLRVRVLANGSAEAIEVKQSSGRKLLDDVAVATVKKWQFTPAKRGEEPIDGWASVPIEFLLDQ